MATHRPSWRSRFATGDEIPRRSEAVRQVREQNARERTWYRRLRYASIDNWVGMALLACCLIAVVWLITTVGGNP
jgi:hypothetical protein